MNRIHKRWLVSIAPLALAAAALAATPALAAPPPAQLVPGEVVGVAGTPNLWVADSQGMIHFASDPRALTGHAVDWDAQLDLPADQLAALPVGEPWLSTALVKIGDAIYLPQWEDSAGAPTLFRIQSPEDLAQLGVNSANYAQDVLDQQAWEQRYNVSLARVEFAGDFDLTPPPPATSDVSNDNAPGSDAGTAEDTTITMAESGS